MAAGDPVSIDVSLRVFERDGTTVGDVACESLTWRFGAGADTPDLTATVSTTEAELAADPDLFDDRLVQLLYDVEGAGPVLVGQLMMVTSDDLNMIGDGNATVTITAKSAVLLANEWRITPAEGVHLRRSPRDIIIGWPHPNFDRTGWANPTRVDPASLTSSDAKHQEPEGWPAAAAAAEWVYDASGSGALSLMYLGSCTVPATGGKTLRKIMVGSSADEEHQIIMYAPGYGAVIIDESDQETGYTHWQPWAEVVPTDEEYHFFAAMTSVDSPGGDGYDALRFFVSTVDVKGNPDTVLLMTDPGNTDIKIWRQDKDDPRPGWPIGHGCRIVKNWIENFITPVDASVNTVTRTFSDTDDSDSVAWDPDTNIERTVRVGDSYASFLDSLSDVVDAEAVIAGGNVKLALYQQRGSDLSASVTLKMGSKNRDGSLLDYRASRRPRTMTRAAFVTEDGMGTRINTSLESSVEARAGFVESLDATSRGEGRALVNRMIAEDGRRQSFSGAVRAVEGAVVGVDCDWGDIVSTLDRDSALSDRRIISWGGSRDGDNEPTMTVELV